MAELVLCNNAPPADPAEQDSEAPPPLDSGLFGQVRGSGIHFNLQPSSIQLLNCEIMTNHAV